MYINKIFYTRLGLTADGKVPDRVLVIKSNGMHYLSRVTTLADSQQN